MKTAQAVPKDRIPEVLAILRSLRAQAPIAMGDVLLRDIAGTGVGPRGHRRPRRGRRIGSGGTSASVNVKAK